MSNGFYYDDSPYDTMLGTEEAYATYLFVKKHKNEVDKELHKKKSELRNLNIMKENKQEL